MTTENNKDAGKKASNDACEQKKVRCKSIVIDGDKYRTTWNKKYENRKKWVKPDPRDIISCIPGTIKDIHIKEGDSVKKGDTLLIMESMKMLNTIEIPMDGKIKTLHVKSEDRVPKGFLLVQMK